MTFSLVLNLINLPKNTILKFKNKKINNAKLALNNGIIASFYNNKSEVFKNLKIAKKTLKKSPLLMLLEFQNSLFKMI